MARIYLSSTYQDLVEYRKAVYQVLRELRHDVLEMEHYTAADERPLKKCLADVGASDLYVGIFAWRYGFVPDDKERNSREESITALEYRRAREKGIATLLFLLNEETPWPPKLHDSNIEPGHADRIKTFRNEVKREHMVSFFSTPDELARKVATAVFQWEKENTPTKVVAPLDIRAEQDVSDDSSTWGIVATAAAKSPYVGEGITVAILSTGVDTNHEAFQGIDFKEMDFTGEGNGDDLGLGTHSVGTICGREVGGRRIGIAPGVTRVLVAKVIGKSGGGSSKTIANGLLWALDHGAQVVCCEVGIDFPGFLRRLVDDGVPPEIAATKMIDLYRYNVRLFESLASICANSCLVIAPAGNESNRGSGAGFLCGAALPAAASGFLSVGAVYKITDHPLQLDVAPFSNIGVDVVAPGVDIPSAKLGGVISTMSGTSMAASHAAGVAALWAQQITRARGTLSVTELGARLRGQASTSLMRLGVGPDDVGCGLVQAPLR
jgi:subtilisin family serine protease